MFLVVYETRLYYVIAAMPIFHESTTQLLVKPYLTKIVHEKKHLNFLYDCTLKHISFSYSIASSSSNKVYEITLYQFLNLVLRQLFLKNIAIGLVFNSALIHSIS